MVNRQAGGRGARLWLLILTGLYLALALWCLGPEDTDYPIRAQAAGRPSGDVVLAARGSVWFEFKGLPPWPARLKATVLCRRAAGVRDLRLQLPGAAHLLRPRRVDGARASFYVPRTGAPWSRVRLVNLGPGPVTVRELNLDHAVAHNSNFPTFTVVFRPHDGRRLAWPWLILLVVAALVLQTPLVWPKGSRSVPRLWLPVLVPAAVLVCALGLLGLGLRLILAWDTYLFVAVLTPALWWLGRGLRRVVAFRRPLPAAMALALMVVLVVGLPMVLPSPPDKAPFDPTPLRCLQKIRPQIIFVGSSICDSRVDPKLLGELLSGQRVYTLWSPATGSAAWYLIFKNYIVASRIRPRVVVFVFYGVQFTWPFRSGEDIRRRYETLTPRRHGLDPEFQRIMFGDLSLKQRVAAWIPRIWPLANYSYPYRLALGEVLVRLAGAPVVEGWREPARRLRKFNQMVRYRFIKHYRPEVRYVQQHPRAIDYSFARMVDKSFLPYFIRLAQEQNIRLIFIRSKRKCYAQGTPQPPALRRYFQQFRAYVEARGCRFYDFSRDPAITLDMYGSGEHMDYGAGRRKWTEIFYKRVGHWLK